VDDLAGHHEGAVALVVKRFRCFGTAFARVEFVDVGTGGRADAEYRLTECVKK
jgi:hypothetical protein